MSATEPRYCPISTLLSTFAVMPLLFPGLGGWRGPWPHPSYGSPMTRDLTGVLDVLLRDPLPGADQRVPGPGPYVRQVDRVDPVCHPARAPHVLPFHSGLAGHSCPVTQNWLICTPSPSVLSTLPGVQTRRSVVWIGAYPATLRGRCCSPLGTVVRAPTSNTWTNGQRDAARAHRTVSSSHMWRRGFHRACRHDHPGDGCRTAANPEFAVNVLEVLRYGPWAHIQRAGDGGVGAAVSD